jgi:hypothetical protein
MPATAQRWYHGDTSKRTQWTNQNMDRDLSTGSPNQYGPGIYWTSDYNQARTYAYPRGYVYEASINTKKFIKPTTRPNKRVLTKLILSLPARDLDNRLADWGYDPGFTSRQDALDQALESYLMEDTLLNAAIGISVDFWGSSVQAANAWAKAMVKIGIHGAIVKVSSKPLYYAVVYNPNTIKVLKEEQYEPRISEWISRQQH